MRGKSLVLIVSLLSTIFVSTNINTQTELKCCGYNCKENNSILAESSDRCFYYKRTEKKEEIKKLMIVAHPDDETIYGGGHLLQDKYTVVCITCGVVDYRVKEFEEVMKKTKDDYIMLGFTDRQNKTGPISNWDNEYKEIYKVLSDIIKSEDWELVITHNPDGEYGHIHHIKTNEIVSNLVSKEKLYYFGRWYHEGSSEQRIDDKIYDKKMNDLISVYYRSQKNALNYNYNMLPYENWIKASEW